MVYDGMMAAGREKSHTCRNEQELKKQMQGDRLIALTSGKDNN
jgi:hypothetical protein